MPRSPTPRSRWTPWPAAAAAARTACVALLAWVLGEALQQGIPAAVLWPLGAVMIGWFALSPTTPADAARSGRRAPDGPSGWLRSGAAGAFAATVAVALGPGAVHGAASGVLIAMAGVALPALSAGLAYYDGLRTASGPANLIQAQRDYFGAHTYERVDRPRGAFFHTDWIESGAAVTSEGYEG